MTSTAPQAPLAAVRPAAVVLLPAEKFFVRRIALTPGQDPAGQVELALETVGPFSPAQIFYGFCPSQDGTQALLYAAYRKNFSPQEIATWATADVVVPEFVVWLAQTTAPAAGAWLYENKEVLQLIAWDGGIMPAGILCRKADHIPADKAAEELLEAAAQRFQIPTDSPRRLGGDLVVDRWSKDGLNLKLAKPGQTLTANLAATTIRRMDVRDKAELIGLAKQQQRNNWLWRTFAGIAAGLILCVVAEIGLLGAGKILEDQREVIIQNGVAVQKIKMADTLADRMEKLAGQKFKPLEMFAVINNLRPASMNFSRFTASSPAQVELEAQTTNAADVSNFEQSLRKAPEIEKVEEVRDQRMRDSLTTFQIQVTFKPGFTGEGDGK